MAPAELDLPGWPAGVAVSPRLAEFLRFLQSPEGLGRFGEFEIYELKSDPLCELTSPEDAEILKHFPPKLGFFARDPTGGELAIWLRSEDTRQCPVVWFDSEGQYVVLGDDLDDFLCLLSGRWRDEAYSELHAEEPIRSWVRQLGLTPHVQSEMRLEPLNLRTLEFLRWFAEEQRKLTARFYPERPLVLDVRPGEQVGVVRLGASESEVSQLLGSPTFASWEATASPTMTAYYAHTPYAVTYERASRSVIDVRIMGKCEIVRLPGGFEPLFATEEEAVQWFRSVDPAFEQDFKILSSRTLGLSMSLNWGYGRRHVDTQTSWVNRIVVSVGGVK